MGTARPPPAPPQEACPEQDYCSTAPANSFGLIMVAAPREQPDPCANTAARLSFVCLRHPRVLSARHVLCAQGVPASSVLESPGSCWYPLAGSILLDGRTMAGRETRSSHLLCWSNAACRAPELLVQDFWPPDIQERLCPCKAARVSQTEQCPQCTASRRMLFFK